jgi:hypothetical protein
MEGGKMEGSLGAMLLTFFPDPTFRGAASAN